MMVLMTLTRVFLLVYTDVSILLEDVKDWLCSFLFFSFFYVLFLFVWLTISARHRSNSDLFILKMFFFSLSWFWFAEADNYMLCHPRSRPQWWQRLKKRKVEKIKILFQFFLFLPPPPYPTLLSSWKFVGGKI